MPDQPTQAHHIGDSMAIYIVWLGPAGVSTRKVDEIAQAMGLDNSVSRSEVSRLCKSLEDDVNDFR